MEKSVICILDYSCSLHKTYVKYYLLKIGKLLKMNVKMFPFLAVIHRHVRNPSENLGLNSLKVTQHVNS